MLCGAFQVLTSSAIHASAFVWGGGVRLGLTDDDVTTGPHLGADDECAAALRPFLLSQLPHGCF